jgi:hypothetical protein
LRGVEGAGGVDCSGGAGKHGGNSRHFVFVGGPTNSLVIHWTGEGRGFRPERKVVVRKEVVTGEQERDVRYHMTDPRRISMSERRGQTVGLIRNIQECLPESQVCYVSMFPRHVTSCCM